MSNDFISLIVHFADAISDSALWTITQNRENNVWRFDCNDVLKSKSHEILLDLVLYAKWNLIRNHVNFEFLYFFNWKFCFAFFLLVLLFISANNQSNERLTATESRSNAISGSSSTFYNNTGNPTIFSKRDTSFEHATNFRNDNNDLDSMHLMLEPHLRPPQPDPNSDISKQIFEEHKKLANEYLKVTTFIPLVNRIYFNLIK